MAKRVNLTDPDALTEQAITQVLADVFPNVRAIHATLFSLAGEGGYTFEQVAAQTGKGEATLRTAFNELGELGLVQLTPELELTEEGDKLLDKSLEVVREMVLKIIQPQAR